MSNTHEPVRAILVDFDGVLRHWPEVESIETSHGLPPGSITKVAFASQILEPCIRSHHFTGIEGMIEFLADEKI